MKTDIVQHWDQVYTLKSAEQMSWTQDVPHTSLEFIHASGLSKEASIIDVGGGDSKLVDYLMEEGYQNITVLDISAEALSRAKKRLGQKAIHVKWIVSDVTAFQPSDHYDFWHDRATFHFLTSQDQIVTYLSIAKSTVKDQGVVTIGTFSEEGPNKCSGLDTKQYSEEALETELQNGFSKIKCIKEDHKTPFNTTQNFLFCSFRKKAS